MKTRVRSLYFGTAPLRVFLAFFLAAFLAASAALAGSFTCVDIFDPHQSSSVAVKYFRHYEARPLEKIEETTGIEVEAAVPLSLGAQGVAESMATTLESLGYSVQKSFHYETLTWKNKAEVYTIRYMIGDVPYVYSVKQDYSVLAGVGYAPLEIVSPVLRDQHDYEAHRQALVAVEALGVKAEPNTAGIHIHVGMKDATVAELGLLGYVFQMIEKDLTKQFSVARSRLPFIRPTDPVLQEIFTNNGTLGTSVRDFLDDNFQDPNSRRHALNMRSMLKYGTVEFRLFNSTMDYKVIDFQRRLASGLVRAIRMKSPAFIDWVMRMEKGEATFEQLLAGVGISKQEWVDVHSRIEVESSALIEGKRTLLLRKILSAPVSLYQGYVQPYFYSNRREGWSSHQ